MTFVTAELLADWCQYVINRVVEELRNQVGQPIIDAVAAAHATIRQVLEELRQLPNLFASVRADLAALPTLNDLTRSHSTALPSPQTTENPEGAGQNRVFFSNLGAALASTQAVLSNLPPRSYPMSPPSLPLEELFGQLHALHANNVQWFRHLENLMAANDQHLDAQIASLREHQSKTLQTTTAALLSEIARVIGTGSSTSTTLDDLLERLNEISARLPSATSAHAIEVLADAVNHLQGGPGAPSTGQSELPPLPPYQATHPTVRPRTHGILRFDEVHTRVPMDMTSRPPSTSLELTLAIRRLPAHTEVMAALYDAGALLLSKHIRTPHLLEDLPGDALALLHHACPAFVYKLSRLGAC